MTTANTTHSIAWAPLTVGIGLWASATSLMLEEAIRAGRYDVATLSVPVLTAATVASAVMVHRAGWRRPLTAFAFLCLACLGSIIMATGTLGRLAEAKDSKEATVNAANRTFGHLDSELKVAKLEAQRECKTIGPRCQQWQRRVDTLTGELAGHVVRSSDPKAESIARLASLLGGNHDQVREIVSAFDPVLLPLFLEFGSVFFFAGAFAARKSSHAVTLSQVLPEVAAKVFTKESALADFRSLKASNSQSFLADRWQVSEGTVSKWMKDWQSTGTVHRKRDGRAKVAALALPAPRHV